MTQNLATAQLQVEGGRSWRTAMSYIERFKRLLSFKRGHAEPLRAIDGRLESLEQARA